MEFEVHIDGTGVAGDAYAVTVSGKNPRIFASLSGSISDGRKLDFRVDEFNMDIEATYSETKHSFVGKLKDHDRHISCALELTKN